MDIRLLGPEDATAYRELRLRALREHPEAFTASWEEDEKLPPQTWQQRLSSPEHSIWGAFDGPRLGGLIGLERLKRAKEKHKGILVGMYVVPEWTGRGVGRALIDALVNQARAEGLSLLVLSVSDDNSPAAKLYELAGFRAFGVEPGAIRVNGRPLGKKHMYLPLERP